MDVRWLVYHTDCLPCTAWCRRVGSYAIADARSVCWWSDRNGVWFMKDLYDPVHIHIVSLSVLYDRLQSLFFSEMFLLFWRIHLLIREVVCLWDLRAGVKNNTLFLMSLMVDQDRMRPERIFLVCDYYYYYAAFKMPCVGHKDDESQVIVFMFHSVLVLRSLKQHLTHK